MRKAVAIAIGLFSVVSIAVLWGALSHLPEKTGKAPSAVPAPASDASAAPVREQQQFAESAGDAAGSQHASAVSDGQAAVRKPTLGLDPTPPLTPEERETHREELAPYQAAWDQHVAPLLYPPGHPLEETYLDSVTCEQAVDAQLRYYEAASPPGDLDKPRLRVQKRFNFRDLNERAKSWDRTNLASTREFYEWMVAQPEDPKGAWGDIWVDAEPSDPDVTTRREFLRERILARETSICTPR